MVRGLRSRRVRNDAVGNPQHSLVQQRKNGKYAAPRLHHLATRPSTDSRTASESAARQEFPANRPRDDHDVHAQRPFLDIVEVVIDPRDGAI